MSVPVTDPIDQYVVVGGEPTFTYNWLINSESEIVVQRQDNSVSPGVITTLTLTTDYTVQGVGEAGGGTITPQAAQLPLVAGDVWTLFRDSIINRPQDFATSGAFAAVTVNQQLDNLTRIAQDRKRDVDEAVKKDPAVGDALNPLIPQMISGRALKLAETTPGNFVIVMSETDPDDGSVKTVAGLFATVLNTPSNIVVQESQDGFEVRVDTSAGDVDITLPDSSVLTSDFRVGIVKTTSDSNVVNVKVQGSDTTNGGTSDFVQTDQFKRFIYTLDQSSAAYIVSLPGITNLVEDTSPQLGGPLDTNGFSINESQGASVASAAQPDIWGTDGNTRHMTGAVQVDDFTDAPLIGSWRRIIVDTGFLMKNGSGISLPGAVDILTRAGDIFDVYADGAVNVFKVINYTRGDGTPLFGLIQRVFTIDGAVATGTGAITVDDSIPSNTEGTLFMTRTITPKAANNILMVAVVWNGAVNASASPVVTLHREGGVAIAVSFQQLAAASPNTLRTMVINHPLLANSTSELTFTVRAGGNIAGTTTFNGQNGSRRFGGSYSSSIIITETTP